MYHYNVIFLNTDLKYGKVRVSKNGVKSKIWGVMSSRTAIPIFTKEWLASIILSLSLGIFIIFAIIAGLSMNGVIGDASAAAETYLTVPGEYPTIQSAIDAAYGTGEIILVDDGTYSENISFNNKALTVRSVNGAALTTIQGDGTNKPVVKFESGEGPNSALDGFTIDNQLESSSASRGVYIVDSSPTIENCTVQGNSISGDNNGGGIYISGGGATIEDTVVGGSGAAKNTAAYGGGIYFVNSTAGALTVSDSTITYNSSTYSGGIYLENIANTISINGSTIGNNTAERHSGGIYLNNASLSVYGSNIDDNESGWDGGGLFVAGNSGLAIDNSSVSGNSGRWAGGIWFNSSGGSLSIDNSEIDDNTASGSSHGGGIYMDGTGYTAGITGSSINDNTAGNDGGGLYIAGDSQSVAIDGSTINDNSARLGGGLVFSSYTDGTLSISNSEINGNYANLGMGGGLRLIGGALTPTVVVERTLIAGNRAVGSVGGGIYISSGSGSSIDASFKSCNVTGNQSDFSAGGGFWVGSAGGTTADIINCTVSGNTATYGGAIHTVSGVTVANSVLWGNNSSLSADDEVDGAAVAVYSNIDQDGFEGADGNIRQDPLFYSPVSHTSAPTADGDYHILPDSPNKDAASAQYAADTDIDGDERPQGPGYDMGSDEIFYKAGEPMLILGVSSAFWASYADYGSRKLSVEYEVINAGDANAYNVQLASSNSSGGVTCVTAVGAVSKIEDGEAGSIVISYNVPAGVDSFFVFMDLTAQDSYGNSFDFSGPSIAG